MRHRRAADAGRPGVSRAGHTPQEMRDAIHKEIEKLKTTDVTDAELEMFKTRARADVLLREEGGA